MSPHGHTNQAWGPAATQQTQPSEIVILDGSLTASTGA